MVPSTATRILHGAGAVVVGLFADRLGGVVDHCALLVGEERRGRLLHEFLVAALQGAVAGADDDDVAVRVGEHLGFDVAGPVEVALDEAFAAPEGRFGLADGRLEQVGDLVALAGDLEAAPAAAEGGLDGHGQAVLVGERDDLARVLDRVLGAGHQGHVRLHGEVAGGDLVTEVPDGLRGRPDPGETGVDHGLRELGVLGEEPVPGVDGVRSGPLGDPQQLVDPQVGVGGGEAVEGEGLVGQKCVGCIAIAVGVDGDARSRRPGRPG